MLTDEQIKANRNVIIRLLTSTKRNGVKSVLEYLDSSGFYEAPSSIDRHHNWRGGLAQHSLSVCNIAIELGRGLPLDSVIIAGLLHDICKAAKLYYDENKVIRRRNTHIKGHGYRSIKLLKICGLELTDKEVLAIRWHMGGHHASLTEKIEVIKAREDKLWKVIHHADKLDASGRYKGDIFYMEILR